MVYIPTHLDSREPLAMVIRASVPPEVVAPAVRDTIRRLAPSTPISRIESMEHVLGAARRPQQFNAAVLGAFAWIALVLSGAGIWAVIAQAVVRRRREIGIRVAFGAPAEDIVRMVAARGVALAAAGVALGLSGALLLGRLLQRVLFGVDTADPATLVVTSVAFLLVAAIASILPARRALSVDPVEVLRAE
jgi:ABC-type antimicrobial peptide transport system permease subunit